MSGEQKPDGINHGKLLKYIGKRGIPVVDNKRLDGNGNPIPAKLLVIGTNGSRELFIQTGPRGDEKYPIADKDAVEKIIIMRNINGISG